MSVEYYRFWISIFAITWATMMGTAGAVILWFVLLIHQVRNKKKK